VAPLPAGGAEVVAGAAEVAGAVLAGPVVAGPVLEGAVVVLELELQAVAPAARQAAMTITRHREPVPIRIRILVERIIAPFRLSAVNRSCIAAPLVPADAVTCGHTEFV
jgi:hypothetical protein